MSEKLAYDINEFCEAAGVGRSFVYEELAAGNLKAKKFGRKNVILRAEAERWLNQLPDAREL